MTKDCAFKISTFFISTINLYCVHFKSFRYYYAAAANINPSIHLRSYTSPLSHTLCMRPSSLIGIQFLNNISSSTLPLMPMHVVKFLEVQEMRQNINLRGIFRCLQPSGLTVVHLVLNARNFSHRQDCCCCCCCCRTQISWIVASFSCILTDSFLDSQKLPIHWHSFALFLSLLRC